MGRKRLDEDSETGNDTFRLPVALKADFAAMCAELGKDKAEVYREMIEAKLRKHHHLKRLKARTARKSA